MTWATALGFVRKNWIYFAIGAALVVALLLAYCAGGSGEREKQDQRTIKIERKVGDANENAAAARVEDTTKIQEQSREISDAVQNATSGDDARRRSGCVVLRQQGRDTTKIPACRGH
jgi:hypothetical protein